MRQLYFLPDKLFIIFFLLLVSALTCEAQSQKLNKKEIKPKAELIVPKAIVLVFPEKIITLDTPAFKLRKVLVSTDATLVRTGCPNYTQHSTLYFSRIRVINAKIIDWDKKPVKGSTIIVSCKSSKISYIYQTDSNGNFTIDIPDIFKNLQINLSLTEYIKVGFDYTLNKSHYFISQYYPSTKNINLKQRYHVTSDSVIFVIPSKNISEKEQLVKEKFRFRDVQQLGTRYNDIFLRY